MRCLETISMRNRIQNHKSGKNDDKIQEPELKKGGGKKERKEKKRALGGVKRDSSLKKKCTEFTYGRVWSGYQLGRELIICR